MAKNEFNSLQNKPVFFQNYKYFAKYLFKIIVTITSLYIIIKLLNIRHDPAGEHVSQKDVKRATKVVQEVSKLTTK